MLCTQCGTDKPESGFLWRKDRGTHRKPCRECVYKKNKEWDLSHQADRRSIEAAHRAKHRDLMLLRSALYTAEGRRKPPIMTESRRLYMNMKQREYKRNNRHKTLARRFLLKAIEHGYIFRGPCQSCGNPKADAHHYDYSRATEVEWLCKKCHGAEHRKYKMTAVELASEIAKLAPSTRGGFQTPNSLPLPR